jgi:hypothetical protein
VIPDGGWAWDSQALTAKPAQRGLAHEQILWCDINNEQLIRDLCELQSTTVQTLQFVKNVTNVSVPQDKERLEQFKHRISKEDPESKNRTTF